MRSAYKLRKRLWETNPHCEKCGVLTVLPHDVDRNIINGIYKLKVTPDNMATIQHVHPVGHPLRGTFVTGVRKNKLWCFKCNAEDAKELDRERTIEAKRVAAKNGHHR